MASPKRLTEEQCECLLKENGTPERVIRHCRAVSETASRIAEELNRSGCHFDVELIRSSGLIHDVRRTDPDHAASGADLLESIGYPDEAAIVRDHMRHRFRALSEADETDIVCLGDRLVEEDQYVGLHERIAYLIHKWKAVDERVHRIIIGMRKECETFIYEIETRIGRPIDSLFRPPLDELLKQVEKPGRYIGGETNMVRKKVTPDMIRFAFAFPDLYEIGMSYMGLQILYNITNRMDEVYCERVFSPAPDMERLLRENDIDLFTLETKKPVGSMDVVGFTLQYEMSYTTILNMLELSNIPLLAKDRTENDPLIVAGGPCAFNPEPLAPFFDLFMVGDGEETLPAVLRICAKAKREGQLRSETLKELQTVEGVYIPSFYEPEYNEDGTVRRYRKVWDGAPDRVKKAIVHDLNDAVYPMKPLVPIVEAVHDRAVVETFRGCTRGCRFCQAGILYRPVRERSKEQILDIAASQIDSTGHDEMSVLSLSTSDYSDFEGLCTALMESCAARNVALSLPSLRLDSFSFRVLDEIQKYKKSGLTFAPEAGTQRLRDVINKGIREEDITDAVRQAIELGWRHIKLYFMDGLPTETDEDLEGIADISRKVMHIFRASGRKGQFTVTASVSNFVPKAHTPFQWAPQCSAEEFRRKHEVLKNAMKIKGVRLSYHDDETSRCEAIFARGDRRCAELLLSAHEAGCTLDAWGENYRRDTWNRLLDEWNIDYRFYTERERPYDEVLPWDVIDSGVTKEYLIREAEKAKNAETTKDCRYGCNGCGLNERTICRWGGIYE